MFSGKTGAFVQPSSILGMGLIITIANNGQPDYALLLVNPPPLFYTQTCCVDFRSVLITCCKYFIFLMLFKYSLAFCLL